MASRGSVYRRGATWTAHVSWGSGATKRQVKKGGYRTRKEAQAALTELLGSIDAGTFVTPSRLTLRRYLDDWLAGLATAGRRPTTIDRYGRMIGAYVSPRIGDVPLQQLSVLDLDRSTRRLPPRVASVAVVACRCAPCATCTRSCPKPSVTPSARGSWRATWPG